MAFTLIKEQKESFPLIEFTFGIQKIYATTSKSPITWMGNKYIPEPTIDVKMPTQTGGTSEEPCVVTLPLLRGVHVGIQNMALQLSKPRSAPPTEIRIINLLKASEEEFTPIYLFDGVMSRLRRNPEGNRGVVELEFVTEWRYQLKDISLGRRADPECDHIYAARTGCTKDNSQFFSAIDHPNYFGVSKRVSAIATFYSVTASREVTLTINPAVHTSPQTNAMITGQPRGWWVRSFLEKDLVRIPIQDWLWNEDLGISTNIFILNRIPPEDWQNAVVTLVIDCDHTVRGCTQRNNIEEFGGLGFGIPAYNPTLEISDS